MSYVGFERAWRDNLRKLHVERICRYCGTPFPIGYFCSNKSLPGGRTWECYGCRNSRRKHGRSVEAGRVELQSPCATRARQATRAQARAREGA